MILEIDLLKSPHYIIKRLQRRYLIEYGKLMTGRVLDIGCGKKPFQRFLSSLEYVGMDNNSAVKPDVVGVIESIPFANQYFDNVLCNEVLEHIPEPKLGLQEIHRVLRSGGLAYVTVPMSWYLHYEPHDFYRYTKYGLEYLAISAGFKVVEIKRLGGLFSVLSQFWIDFLYFIILRLTFFLPAKIKTGIALLIIAPSSLLGYYTSLVLDKMDKKHALGWVAVFQKP